MVLLINADVGNVAQCDENESPLGKRKSELISPSNAAARSRGPLSDVNYNPEEAKIEATTYKTPPSPARTSLPPYSASRSAGRYSLSSGHKFTATNSANKFLPRLPVAASKEAIQATDEKQASVNQLSEWLATESARKAKKNKPPVHYRQHNATTPIKFNAKPRIKKADVEATDSKRVSVKTLSSWMSNDPFEQKKVRTIRSGTKVIAKSRIFEKDQVLAASRTCDIKTGSVGDKQAWLNGAFKHEGEEVVPQTVREQKVRPYQMKKKEETPVKELKSVQDKKEWFSKAFQKSDGDQSGIDGIQQTSSFDQHPIICHTKSFEVNNAAPAIMKSASSDVAEIKTTLIHPMIHQTKSCDGISIPTTAFEKQLLERQRSVVRLYAQKNEEKDESEEAPPKSVHDKQAWLSNAFKKHDGKEEVGKSMNKVHAVDSTKKSVQTEVEEKRPQHIAKKEQPAETQKDSEDDENPLDKMSVADRAKWLRGAFK